ncbi:MAG: glycolate oxidase subunit GlcE [Pseudomonadota bacterium]
MNDCSTDIANEIQRAFQEKTALRIEGGSSKSFYGRSIDGKPLSLSQNKGIIEYEPSELYITAKSGTPLSVIEETIAKHSQVLPCEPPQFSNTATIGGMVACGLSGPRRASSGSVRDCLLGTEIINGKGETLRFGGRVMKNVAGYDTSRLMCGALGTLGVLMSVTLRLLPKPAFEETIVLELSESAAVSKMNDWASTPLPISATFYNGSCLYVRLSGSTSAVKASSREIGGDTYDTQTEFWESIKEHQHAFFNADMPLWRVSVPPNTQNLTLPGESVMEWNGGLRWCKSDANEKLIREKANNVAGHATLFKSTGEAEIFHPLPITIMNIHKKLKQVFDPAGILNPGKMFAEI